MMQDRETSETTSRQDQLLTAMLPHVVFDGWSDAALAEAGRDLGMSPGEVKAHAPRGALGMAALFHRKGDQQMVSALKDMDFSGVPFRARIAQAVRIRLEGQDREIIRRGTTLFAMPHHAAEGAKLIWETCDAIWTALGDTSEDVNWYTKRMTLAGVYSSVVLYWLGDSSEGSAETWAFLDRRIEDVMRIEKAKAKMREMPILGRLMAHPLNPLTKVKAPGSAGTGDWRRHWPGSWQGRARAQDGSDAA